MVNDQDLPPGVRGHRPISRERSVSAPNVCSINSVNIPDLEVRPIHARMGLRVSLHRASCPGKPRHSSRPTGMIIN